MLLVVSHLQNNEITKLLACKMDLIQKAWAYQQNLYYCSDLYKNYMFMPES